MLSGHCQTSVLHEYILQQRLLIDFAHRIPRDCIHELQLVRHLHKGRPPSWTEILAALPAGTVSLGKVQQNDC